METATVPQWARRLRATVDNRGLIHRWVADQCGVTEPTVSRWLAGTNEPVERHKRMLAQLLGVEYAWLWWGAPEPKQ